MLKIAFLTFDWNYNVAYEYSCGVQRFTESHPDISVYVFNGMGKYTEITAVPHNFEIFNIADLDRYDGVVFQANRTWPVERRQLIADQCAARNIPAVSVNYPLNHCTYIGTDNYEAMKKMITHLIQVHGVRRMYFITGLKTSNEALSRLQAFKDTCRYYGISDYRIIEGDWEPVSGRKAAKQIAAEGKENLPEALVCSNDDEAAAALDVFKENGIHAPEDILVTGFDNRDVAEAYEPRITSVDRDYASVLSTALETLYEKMQGAEVPERVYSPAAMKYEGTCGCNAGTENVHSEKEKYFEMDASFKKYFFLQNYLHEDMMQSRTVPELMDAFEKLMPDMQLGIAYLMIDKQYLDGFDSDEDNHHYSHTAVLMASNDPEIKKCHPKTHIYESVETSDILPAEYEKKGGTQYNIYPVGSKNSCIGFLITEGISDAARYNTIQLILLLLASDMENLRKSRILQKMNNHLGDLYITDQLSGLYNRFGMEHFGRFFFRKTMIQHKSAWICFIDIDDMKHINDRWGHENGDSAIKDAADIIREGVGKENVFAMRYGGDEFLVMGSISMKQNIQKALDRYHETDKRIYDLDLSIGEYQVTAENENLDACIRLADDAMYQVKKKRKEEAALKGMPFAR